MKISTLCWFDLLIITLIMFSGAIYDSNIQYIYLKNEILTLEDNLTFTSEQNYRALAIQAFYLVLVFFYLLYRKFDFNLFISKINFTRTTIFAGILIFIFAALLMDIYYILLDFIGFGVGEFNELETSDEAHKIDFSLIIYALLNGFYEEIFFLGICLAVEEKYLKFAFLYSLLIRFSFHTYQGLETAAGLGFILGSVFYLIYLKMKSKNLLPFFIAHSIADVVGLSVLYMVSID